MIGKKISHGELTPACGGIFNLNPSIKKRGTFAPLLFLSRRSPLSAGEKGTGDEFRIELTLNPSLRKRGTKTPLLFLREGARG
jgi:hypothetical protein